MAKERQLPFAFDIEAKFAALRLDVSDVEKMMDDLERSFGRKPTTRKLNVDEEQAEKPTTPKVLSLGARVSGSNKVAYASFYVHVVDRGSLDITVYNHKDRSVELTDATFNKIGEGERITFKVQGHRMVVNVDAKFRTGSAYFQVGDMKIGVAELKECPLNPFED